ncbi:MAG: S-layer homology domain-containing protein [Actinomycetota bacterium]
MTLTLTRRGFLGASGATGLAATLPLSVLAKAAGAAPPGPTDGIVLTVFLRGGNDSLNTFGPFGNGTYNDQRLSLAINPGSAHDAGGGLYFHPSLSYLHQRWNAGDVAIIPGIGEPNNDRSHFTSTSTWMSGVLPGDGSQSTGWMGRWLDTKGIEVLGASVDGGTPKQIRGASSSVVGVSRSKGNLLPTGSREQPVNVALRAHTGGGLSPMGDAFGAALNDAARFSADQLPLYAEGIERSEDRFTADLQRAAHLLNLGLGVRCVSATLGGFDTHSNQADRHAGQLASLDGGLRGFFETLLPALHNQTTVLVVSEFGRRLRRNNSNGTDHGAAGVAFVLGSKVNGGLIGEYPSLTDVTRRGDLKHNVDFRSLYATVLDTWMAADPQQILGGSSPSTLSGLFTGGPAGTGVAGFLDAQAGSYYAGALQWAVANEVVGGTTATTFEPHRQMTRAEFAAIQWRAAGQPLPQGPNPFVDVPNGDWFTNAVLWMVEQGITSGTSPTTFHPHRTLTRAECATFMWRRRGRPSATTVQNFSDVGDGRFYTNAVKWMASEGITTGTTPTTFSPHDNVDRAQAVTFLHREQTRLN